MDEDAGDEMGDQQPVDNPEPAAQLTDADKFQVLGWLAAGRLRRFRPRWLAGE